MMESAGVRFRSNANRRGGLATITGAVEVRLIDLVNAYATIGRGGVHRDLRLFEDDPSATRRAIGVDACALLNQILGCDGRNPDVDHPGSWFMWKTGTSSSRRDAWAVGHNGRFAIGVWTGRFSSAGRVDYVGARAAEPLLTTLFNEPALANPNSPDHFASKIVVRKPLPAPAEMGGGLRIVSPHDGSVFVAIGDEATVHPRSNVNGAKWFLDGSMLAAGEAARLRVKPGRHELRCIDDSGGSHAVRFVVRR
jgi:penicillin-binding protein 1C